MKNFDGVIMIFGIGIEFCVSSVWFAHGVVG